MRAVSRRTETNLGISRQTRESREVVPFGTMTIPVQEDVRFDETGEHAAGTYERYATRDLLGRGGMGTVYLVHDRRIGREVALKQLTVEQPARSATLARFAREARVQGRLEHPAIVPVYDIGTTEDGSPFFTMKQVNGASLTAVLDEIADSPKAKYTRRKLLAAFSQLCVAVHYAHERGVIHRDIKPSNIMLGAYGEVYLLDWGVAKICAEPDDVDGEALLDGVHTAHGAVIGSLHTIAPEQAVGGEIDARADVYALGAVLFEILTLQPLHPRGDVDAVLATIMQGVDARASERAPWAEVPPELEALCVAATRVHPDDRIGSALELHEAIERFLDGDRDLAVRLDGARQHATRARALADEVLHAEADKPAIGELQAHPLAAVEEAEPALRAEALREVGRALALDPENPEALGTLVRLLTSAPKVPPREVLEEHHALVRSDLAIAGRSAALFYGGVVLASVPTWFAIGGTNLLSFVVAHVLWGAALVAALVTMRRQNYVAALGMYVVSLVVAVWLSSIFSPLVMVPGLLAAHAAGFATVSLRRIRLFVLATTVLAFLIALGGSAFGVLPETLRVVDGDLVIHTDVFAWTKVRAFVYLGTTTLAAIVAPIFILDRLTTSCGRAVEEMFLQRWQLRQVAGSVRPPKGP